MNERLSPVRVSCLRVAAACVLATLFSAVFAADDAERARATAVENRIKAAFLYHFCNYVRWPDGTFERADSPIVLGVIGPESVAREIEQAVNGRFAHGHPLSVRRVNAYDPLDEVHLLFVDASANARIPNLVVRLADGPVLVVTDEPDGLEAGASINFVIENDKVRFDVGLDTARERGLRVSAQLLTVAREIRGGEH